MMHLMLVHLIKCLVLFAASCWANLQAPSGLRITNVTSTGFLVSFDHVPNAIEYEVNITSIYDLIDTTKIMTTRNIVAFNLSRSNIVYSVRVQAIDRDGEHGLPASELKRTAPNGVNVIQAITTPTFLTLFLDDVPATMSWEIELNNTITSESRIIRVPQDTLSRTRYIAIINYLDPNTFYTVRARISEIDENYPQKFTVSQSPFGAARQVSTERISVFGRVELVGQPYSRYVHENTSLIKLVEYQLRQAYQKVARNAFWVRVISFADSGNENILCHHEVLLDDRTSNPYIANLTLNDASLFKDGKVKFQVSKEPGYVYNAFNELKYKSGGRCVGDLEEMEVDVLKWKAYSLNNRQFLDLRKQPTRLGSSVKVVFEENTLQVNGITIMLLEPFTIYGMKHDYLVANCPADEKDAIFYDRLYVTNSGYQLARDYTVLHSTGASTIQKSRILAHIDTAYDRTILMIPSSLIPRLSHCNFFFNEEKVASLQSSLIDSSHQYRVSLPRIRYGNMIDVNAYSWDHYGKLLETNFTLKIRQGPIFDDEDPEPNPFSRIKDSKARAASPNNAGYKPITWLAGPIIAYIGLIVFTSGIGCYLGKKFNDSLLRAGKSSVAMNEDEQRGATNRQEATANSIREIKRVVDVVVEDTTPVRCDVTDDETRGIWVNQGSVSDPGHNDLSVACNDAMSRDVGGSDKVFEDEEEKKELKSLKV